jgi:hypothetical protein
MGKRIVEAMKIAGQNIVETRRDANVSRVCSVRERMLSAMMALLNLCSWGLYCTIPIALPLLKCHLKTADQMWDLLLTYLRWFYNFQQLHRYPAADEDCFTV